MIDVEKIIGNEYLAFIGLPLFVEGFAWGTFPAINYKNSFSISGWILNAFNTEILPVLSNSNEI